MPNQLDIPFKKTFAVPIKQAVYDYLNAHGNSHPEQFKWDISRWDALRRDGVGGAAVHVDRINDAIRFERLLAFQVNC